MQFFVNKIQNKTDNTTVQNNSVSFRGVKGNGKITELSDDLFKIASAAIAATGVATLGINANKHIRKRKIEEAETVESPEKLVSRFELAEKYLHVNIHTVNWHINKGRLFLNEDNLIDLNDERNKRFIENFQKGSRKRGTTTLYRKGNYAELQKILGDKLPLEYCLKNGILIQEEDESIDITKEPNRSIVEKIKSKELTYKDFFMSAEKYAAYLGVASVSIERAIERGDVVLTKSKRIDINDEKNKAFEIKVKQAKDKAAEKGLKRITSFVRVRGGNPNLYTRTEFAQKVGFKTAAGLTHHIRNGRVVVNKDGYIDISVEPNKSFAEAKINGTYIAQPDLYQRNKTKKEVNPNLVSQVQFSKMMDIAVATLRYHIKAGRVVVNDNGKIDITDEKNKYFLEHHQKGVTKYPQKVKEKAVVPEEKQTEIKNPNLLTIVQVKSITGLGDATIQFHLSKNRLIRENKKIDITNPVNKRFIDSYEEKLLEVLDNMSDFELKILGKNLENRYKSLLPRDIYIQAKEAKNTSKEEYDRFIKELTFSLFRVEILSARELQFVEKTVKKIIDTRINDKEMPEDFSDIKEFKLSGVIELEHELNIMDKLIERQEHIELATFDINDLKNKNTKLKADYNIAKIKDFLKKPFPEDLKEKIKKFLSKPAEQQKTELLPEFDKMTVEELQAVLFELHQAKELKEHKKLLQAIEFLFSYDAKAEEEKEILAAFTRELHSFVKNPAEDKDVLAEILARVHKLEEDILNEEERKQARFEWVNNSINDCIKLLYDKGFNSAAEVVFANIPKAAESEQEIRNAVYLISVINKLKTEPKLSDKDDKLSAEAKAEKIEKMKKLRDLEIENTILGYDAFTSDSEFLQDAVKYSRNKYGVNKYKYVGEYVRHISNIENGNYSDYPAFAADVLPELSGLEKNEAVDILIKLQAWKSSSEKEQKSFTKIFDLFSKKDPIERKIIENYIKKYYVNFDTTIMAVGVKDKSLKIPAILTVKAKKQMVKDIAENQLIDYFEEFEYAMTRIIGPDGHSGIKKYENSGKKAVRTHEVTVSYPARLYCHKNALFVFDEFVYDSHKGGKS